MGCGGGGGGGVGIKPGELFLLGGFCFVLINRENTLFFCLLFFKKKHFVLKEKTKGFFFIPPTWFPGCFFWCFQWAKGLLEDGFLFGDF